MDKPHLKGGRAAAKHPPMSRREAGKSERRHRIIQAAHELIRETGNAGLSMRALAARAGVSLATPYNLFGSKRAIIWAVLDDVREYQDRFAKLRTADPIDRIFAALELALDFYKNDPKFYKTLWAAAYDVEDEVRADIFNPQRNAFWTKLLADACEAGALTKTVPVDLLFMQFDFIGRSAMFGWVAGDIPQSKLTPTVVCGVSMLLLSVAAPRWRKGLQARLEDSVATLRRKRGK